MQIAEDFKELILFAHQKHMVTVTFIYEYINKYFIRYYNIFCLRNYGSLFTFSFTFDLDYWKTTKSVAEDSRKMINVFCTCLGFMSNHIVSVTIHKYSLTIFKPTLFPKGYAVTSL